MNLHDTDYIIAMSVNGETSPLVGNDLTCVMSTTSKCVDIGLRVHSFSTCFQSSYGQAKATQPVVVIVYEQITPISTPCSIVAIATNLV